MSNILEARTKHFKQTEPHQKGGTDISHGSQYDRSDFRPPYTFQNRVCIHSYLNEHRYSDIMTYAEIF